MIFFKYFQHVYLCLWGLLVLTGCANTIQPSKNLSLVNQPKIEKKLAQLHQFKISGKLGFSQGKQGGNVTLHWEQSKENYHIQLLAPLGSGSLQIRGHSKRVFLILPTGESLQAKNPDQLIEEQLGWTIPLSGLSYWIRGIPAPGCPPTAVIADDKKRIRQIKQQGWIITYHSYQQIDGLELPLKLILKHQDLQLKLFLRHWQVTPALY